MADILLIDSDGEHAFQVGNVLAQRGLTVTRVADIDKAINCLHARVRAWEIVVLVIDGHSRPWSAFLNSLQETAWQRAMPEVPLFLCVAKRDMGADFQLRIERMGARYACEE